MVTGNTVSVFCIIIMIQPVSIESLTLIFDKKRRADYNVMKVFPSYNDIP